MARAAVAAFEHHIALYRRNWRGSVATTFLMPVLFLLGLGWSVGRYVDAQHVLTVSYLAYTAPGLLASIVFQVAVTEATYPVMSAFQWKRIYIGMQDSPMTAPDILAGQLGYILARAAAASVGFLLVMLAFGVLRSPWAPLALPVTLLLTLASAAPVLAFTTSIGSSRLFPILHRFVVVPATLFAGVFFPVDTMPAPARVLAYVSPLWHGVQLTRAVTLGQPTQWPPLVHVGYLELWAVVGYLLARRGYLRRLVV
jgi:lipooligosaccharide transport system permease protein